MSPYVGMLVMYIIMESVVRPAMVVNVINATTVDLQIFSAGVIGAHEFEAGVTEGQDVGNWYEIDYPAGTEAIEDLGETAG